MLLQANPQEMHEKCRKMPRNRSRRGGGRAIYYFQGREQAKNQGERKKVLTTRIVNGQRYISRRVNPLFPPSQMAKMSGYNPNQDANHFMLRQCVLDFPFQPYVGKKMVRPSVLSTSQCPQGFEVFPLRHFLCRQRTRHWTFHPMI